MIYLSVKKRMNLSAKKIAIWQPEKMLPLTNMKLGWSPFRNQIDRVFYVYILNAIKL
jgi:hypothetical protein